MLLSANHPFLTISQQLTSVCQPLETLGIHHFSYMKQWADGRRFNLSNKPKWIEDYYNLQLYKTSLFENTQEEYHPGFDMWFGDYDIDVYRHGKQYYNTSHTIVVTEITNEYCERYFFATTPDNPDSVKRLGNDIDILHHFIAYLNDRADKLITQADKHRILLPNTPITRNILNKNDHESLKKQFYQKTRVYKYVLRNNKKESIKLSAREIDCIACLLDNCSAKETAILMGISRRTAESYLDNIRLKLNCATKSELFQLIKNNKYLRVLR